MVERNAETENNAIEVLIDEWDIAITDMARYIADHKYFDGANRDMLEHYLDHLDIIERALKRLATPSLR